jgi:threonylcarbamoyladenosine tRNA methylthiotransferase MtaB
VKYAVITFGCRVNQADSLECERDLLTRGAQVASPEEADVVVVNTCSVTASADQAARQTIRRVARANPSARIVVTGCYATRRPDEVSILPNVVRVVPNEQKAGLAGFTSTAVRFGEGEGSCGAALVPGVAGRTAFTLAVQTGCAEPCSYCVIPTTRGMPVSVPTWQALEAVDRAVAAGFKEVAITGVHLGSYGRDLTPATSLAHLLSALAARRTTTAGVADVLFRISSLEPMDCTADIVDLVERTQAFASHFHLPLQHASPRMLDAMRRPYTIDYFADLVTGIRRRIPAASIGSDVIVGFPGESDADFELLADYLERSPLTHLHVFPYSDRPGTVASALPGKVQGSIVRERSLRLRGISARLAARFRAAQVGSVQRALTLDDGTTAVTGNYLKVQIPEGRMRNEWVRIRLRSEHAAELLGG